MVDETVAHRGPCAEYGGSPRAFVRYRVAAGAHGLRLARRLADPHGGEPANFMPDLFAEDDSPAR